MGFCKIEAGGKEDMQIAVEVAEDGFPVWAARTLAQRSELLFKAAAIIKRSRPETAEIL